MNYFKSASKSELANRNLFATLDNRKHGQVLDVNLKDAGDKKGHKNHVRSFCFTV